MLGQHATVVATACAALALAMGSALAQQGPGPGPGGMGKGPGMMGPGMQMGPGMGPGMGQGMGPGMGPGMGMGMHRGMGGGGPMMGCMTFGTDEGKTYADGRLAFLKAELGITDAQKAQWDGYAAALKKNLESMRPMREAMMASMAAPDGSPVERLDLRITAMEARLAMLKEVKPALAGLFGTLSDEQKKKAGELLTTMGCMM